VEIVFPVHLNPLVREPVNRLLSGRERIHLIEPVGYLDFVYLLMRSELVLSDSGGVQEEASTLGRPVLVLRETTERPEGLRSGNMLLVGTKREGIVAEATTLLRDAARRAAMSRPSEAFGDGRASARIAATLRAAFPGC
jgi:UDP-N-acetylglucosamine 2-epimerase (non-hydrolysing)